MAVLVAAIVVLGLNSNLLRDQGGKPAAAAGQPTPKPPYSLARVQMAFWLVLITASYMFLWLITFSMQSLSGSALALLAISAGTGLMSFVIDGSKRQTAQDRKARLEARFAELTTTVGTGTPNQQQADELRRIIAEIQQLKEGLNPDKSENFAVDILSDADGVTVYRLQAAIWTVVLGVIFITEVYRKFTMPDFSPTLLGLMGLSSATYLGFKLPEPTAPTKPPA